ncbi:MAG: ABC transporter ATP-binding protein [Candidatus Electryonea clarkiae]|nr:ABC transporter ATP-binding protein [Candidatus Electryonea clarkiae]MDP8286005.1 ABC transporter ATP-binding protein [Candidatus Electryonea clarkiae]
MVQLENVDKVYQTDRIETLALSNVNITIEDGEFVAVMGPSGCGKSTLLNIMGLLDAPSKGQIQFDNNEINGWSDRKLARFRNETVGFIFQSFHLINDLTVFDNVEIPLLYRRMSASERKKRIAEALERVSLISRMKHRPSQLSGGQQQRVAIARAIVGNPKLLLADEPTGNLDSQMGEDIMSILLDLNKNSGASIVMVTHDSRLAENTERVIHLFDGRQVS